MSHLLRSFIFLLTLALGFPLHAQIPIVTLSTVLTEIAQRVGGDKVQVHGLIEAGMDPHEFEPTPSNLESVSRARLILACGKGLEGYLSKLHESAPQAEVIEVGNALPDLKNPDHPQASDPHWWNSIVNVKQATEIIENALVKIDPANSAIYAQNAAAYQTSLDDLEHWTRLKLAELPRDKRRLVTSHDAFQYFARDYGFTLLPIEGIAPTDQPSSKKISDLIATIEKNHVRAVFFENLENPRVLQEIAHETGAKIGGELYADGLGKGDASTYAGMFRHNITTIVDALK